MHSDPGNFGTVRNARYFIQYSREICEISATFQALIALYEDFAASSNNWPSNSHPPSRPQQHKTQFLPNFARARPNSAAKSAVPETASQRPQNQRAGAHSMATDSALFRGDLMDEQFLSGPQSPQAQATAVSASQASSSANWPLQSQDSSARLPTATTFASAALGQSGNVSPLPVPQMSKISVSYFSCVGGAIPVRDAIIADSFAGEFLYRLLCHVLAAGNI